MKNYYHILGIAATATPAEIKRAYHAQVLNYHPDRNSAPDAAAKFMEVQEAWDTLSNEWRRKVYDDTLYPASQPSETNTNVTGRTAKVRTRPAGTPPHSDPYARQEDVFNEDADPIYEYYDTDRRYEYPIWVNLMFLPIVFLIFMLHTCANEQTHSKYEAVTTTTLQPGQSLVVNGDTVYTQPVTDSTAR